MKSIAYFSIIAVATVSVLIFAKSILIQLIIALLIWFVTLGLRKLSYKIKWFNRFVSKSLQLPIISAIFLMILYFIISSVVDSLWALQESFNIYENNIKALSHKINNIFGINIENQITSILKSLDIKNIISNLAKSLSSILSQSIMILIYFIFILLEADSFEVKLRAFFPDLSDREKFILTLRKIEKSLASYFKVKTLTSLLTGFLAFIVLYLVGIDSPLLWAFLIFALNYIPTIGSLIATIFPAIFSLLQFGTFLPFFMILIFIGAIQQIVGNFIEPRLMGRNLNISPLLTIVALAVWGKMWGIMGMLLSVPITVIIIIILSQFKQTQKIAILFSEKGNL